MDTLEYWSQVKVVRVYNSSNNYTICINTRTTFSCDEYAQDMAISLLLGFDTFKFLFFELFAFQKASITTWWAYLLQVKVVGIYIIIINYINI